MDKQKFAETLKQLQVDLEQSIKPFDDKMKEKLVELQIDPVGMSALMGLRRDISAACKAAIGMMVIRGNTTDPAKFADGIDVVLDNAKDANKLSIEISTKYALILKGMTQTEQA